VYGITTSLIRRGVSHTVVRSDIGPDGSFLPRSEECTCLAFGLLPEAEAYCEPKVAQVPHLRCDIYDSWETPKSGEERVRYRTFGVCQEQHDAVRCASKKIKSCSYCEFRLTSRSPRQARSELRSFSGFPGARATHTLVSSHSTANTPSR
jgi:hypothetical protein